MAMTVQEFGERFNAVKKLGEWPPAHGEIKVWSIGEESELFAAHSEAEVRSFYSKQVGEPGAAEALADHFEEVASGDSLDDEREYDCDGVKKMLSFRQLI